MVIDDIIDERVAGDCMKILNQNFRKLLKPISARIDKEELRNMRENYSEKLAKTLRMQTLEIGGRQSASYEAAARCGLIQLLHSESLRAFGEAVVGNNFGKAENNQLILYQHQDYVSPHNDHHPENPEVRNGYYDMHIMFSNRFVAHQYLIYEKGGFLNGVHDIARPSAIAIYRLPFWHYTTPLLGKRGQEHHAQRWLLLRSFQMQSNP